MARRADPAGTRVAVAKQGGLGTAAIVAVPLILVGSLIAGILLIFGPAQQAGACGPGQNMYNPSEKRGEGGDYNELWSLKTKKALRMAGEAQSRHQVCGGSNKGWRSPTERGSEH